MANQLKTNVCLLTLWLAPSYSGAADLDFERNIICELEYLEMCRHGDYSCRWAEVVEADGKQTFEINIKEKSIAMFEGENLVDKEKINSISVVNEVLYLHGTNPDSKRSKNGTGWVARITKAQGEFSAASLADTQGYLIFGACRNQ
jgi:hypothetical protein